MSDRPRCGFCFKEMGIGEQWSIVPNPKTGLRSPICPDCLREALYIAERTNQYRTNYLPQLRRVLPILRRLQNRTEDFGPVGHVMWTTILDDIDNRKLAEFIEAAEQLLMEE